jgi:tetratricopeptide (TPR) repeat protein
LLPILPTLHFFINGAHSICSHFAYLPSIAPSFAAAAIITQAYKKSISAQYRWSRMLITVVVASLFLFYVSITEKLLGSWKNPETLWTRVINLRPVGRAYYYRADYYMTVGKYLEASEDLLISIRMANSAGYPDVFNLHALRADALNKIGQYKEAVDEFTAAIRDYPHPTYFYHRGRAFESLGLMEDAASDFRSAGEETGPIIKRSRD